MKTYWMGSIGIKDSGNHRIVCSTGADTLAEVLSKAIKDAVYYQAIYPGSTITIEELREVCAACENSGNVRSKTRKFSTVRCPECKGKCPQSTVGTIDFQMPESTNRISLVCA